MNGTITAVDTISGVISAVAKLSAELTGPVIVQGALADTKTISGTISASGIIQGSLTGSDAIIGNITIPEHTGGVYYNGDYEVTPSADVQTLSTAELTMRHNVTINPIPQNYGLITWNGTTLTVS